MPTDSERGGMLCYFIKIAGLYISQNVIVDPPVVLSLSCTTLLFKGSV